MLLNAVDRRLGMLAEVLHPRALDAGVVLGRLDQVHEADDRHLESSAKLLVFDLSVAVEGEVRSREREHVRVDARAEVLEGHAQRQTPRLPPTIEGEADSSACRSWKGCGWKRETQSTEFLSTPGIEALYSGEQTTNASEASSRRRSSSAPAGNPVSRWTSAL